MFPTYRYDSQGGIHLSRMNKYAPLYLLFCDARGFVLHTARKIFGIGFDLADSTQKRAEMTGKLLQKPDVPSPL